MSQSLAPTPQSVFRDVTCTACGCMCDDVELAVDQNHVVGAKHVCGIGEKWFLRDWTHSRPACLVNGRATAWEEGCRRAADLLTAAKRPFVYGLTECTCEAQQLAVSIADWIGARVEIIPNNRPFLSAFQQEGQVTATLGEVAQRADLVIFWGCDPATTHPRHFERYSLEPRGIFVPNGRKGRTCVVVDSAPTATSAISDKFLQIAKDGHGKSFEALRALVAVDALGISPPEPAAYEAEVESQTGVPLAHWQELAAQMNRARYGVLFFDANLEELEDNLPLLLTLVRDMNLVTRFVCLTLGARGNSCGAEEFLTWRTGYPAAVDFMDGFPEYVPGVVETGIDAALVLGLTEDDPPQLANIPTVAIGHDLPTAWQPAVAFQVAAYGIHTGGTVFRCDGVPLPLRAVLKSELPSAEIVLARIENLLRDR